MRTIDHSLVVRLWNRDIQEIALDAKQELEQLENINVNDLDGRKLRKLRDDILRLRQILVASSPEASEILKYEMARLGRDLRANEAWAALTPMIGAVRVYLHSRG